LLAERCDRLIAAGLRRINISLDSLDPARFESITRTKSFTMAGAKREFGARARPYSERFGTRDAFESGRVERIEADVDAAETGGNESVAAFGEQVAVGSHREVFHAEGMETGDVVFDASRTSGSPPVMRIFRIPRCRKTRARRSSSGQESISSWSR